jgi:hypothetical protein
MLSVYKFIELISMIQFFEPFDDNIKFWYLNVPVAKRKRSLHQLWRCGHSFSTLSSSYVFHSLGGYNEKQRLDPNGGDEKGH